MRVVVDTNVFVSAVLKDSSFPAMALRLVERRGVLLKSEATEYQLFEVLASPTWRISCPGNRWRGFKS